MNDFDPRRLIGSILDRRYRLTLFLGQGGYGWVYAADEMIEDEMVGMCAIKLLQPRSAEERASVLSEVRALAQFEHPALVGFRGAGTVPDGQLKGFVYVAMQLADQSLENRLKKGIMSPRDVSDVARNVAHGLAYLHEHDAVHRDVKPANIFRVGNSWKLGDFGLIAAVQKKAVAAAAGTFEGSPLYMAPESIDQKWGPASDVWALGVIMQECLAGIFPYSGDNTTTLMADMILNEPQISPDLPPPFDAIVRGCLIKDPTRRWTARQAADIFERRVVPRDMMDATAAAPAAPVAPPPSRPLEIGKPMPLQGHQDAVRAVAFCPGAPYLASGSLDKTVRLWDVQSGRQVLCSEEHQHHVTSVAFSAEGGLLASGSRDKTVRLRYLSGNTPNRYLVGHTEGVTSVAFSPDERILASGSLDRTIRVWDVYTGEEIGVLQGHDGAVNGVDFSPDGRFLAAASDDHYITIWDTVEMALLTRLPGHTDSVKTVAFSKTAAILASGSADKSVRLWQSHSLLHVFYGHQQTVASVTFSPDGRRLASASWDRSVRLWDLELRREARRLDGHKDWATSVSFSADGTCLASGGVDRNILLWKLC